ncbi:unnamed protein product [Acanthosepion pharaonis]|uniref:Uncharacterized protein n=1 Tax=Acanthosepion pharaonis TaxID=158019 RepID=A0A812EIV2_ACAPH|nr:unnamed protein product [Sepia pharaonis]
MHFTPAVYTPLFDTDGQIISHCLRSTRSERQPCVLSRHREQSSSFIGQRSGLVGFLSHPISSSSSSSFFFFYAALYKSVGSSRSHPILPSPYTITRPQLPSISFFFEFFIFFNSFLLFFLFLFLLLLFIYPLISLVLFFIPPLIFSSSFH